MAEFAVRHTQELFAPVSVRAASGASVSAIQAVPGASVLIRRTADAATAAIYTDRTKGTAVSNPVPTGVPEGSIGLSIFGNLNVFLDPDDLYETMVTVGGTTTGPFPMASMPRDPAEPIGAGAVEEAMLAFGVATQAELDAGLATREPSIPPGTYPETARAAGVLPNGSDMAALLQSWADTLDNRAKLGILPPGTYRIDDTVLPGTESSISAYGALLQAPVDSAFIMVHVLGTAPSRKSDVTIAGLAVDMRATELAGDAAGFGVAYTDDARLIDVKAMGTAHGGIECLQCARLWIVRPRVDGVYGDGIHLEEVTKFVVDSPIITGLGHEAGIGTTGGTTQGTVIAPDISGSAIGIGISGGHDIAVRGGTIHDIEHDYGPGGVSIGIKVEAADGNDSYDITFDGTKIIDLDQTDGYGVSINEPNRNNANHPITFRNCDFDTGARPCLSIVSAGEVVIEDTTIRTTGAAIAISGTAPKPNGITRLRRVHFIGTAPVVYGSTADHSGTLYYEDCTLNGNPLTDDDFEDPDWPVNVGHDAVTDWLPLTLVNSWENAPGFAPARYRRIGEMVEVDGVVMNGVAVDVAALPPGFVPPTTVIRSLTSGDAATTRCDIQGSGAITLKAVPAFVSLACSFSLSP